ncbi:ThuA domain-containing protein [Membranihabitans maritimus]|uniref:ThuA domain-containing protein n=1 Tax=Membranihabitans maritimus TaxID=2904244 RepID=UPI001F1A6AE2|nr:ThuA domain-containing protein [Membranihabitans maritimus]
MINSLLRYIFVGLLILLSQFLFCQDRDWITFFPSSELNNGKRIVLISGDESYRSEESLPMLAKILTYHHGFHTTVLFSINPNTGFIDPNYHHNIPGIYLLDSADLLILSTRFRELPNEQMKFLDRYLNLGKPIIGLRTATHAFRFREGSDSKYLKYDYRGKGQWNGGFGKKILGETWVSHHGLEKEGTVSLLDGFSEMEKHPILKGVGMIYCPSGVYSSRRLDSSTKVLLWGAATNSLYNDSIPVFTKSIMPIAWVRTYKIQENIRGKVFTTTLGASVDFLDKDLRKLVINAVYWTLGFEDKIPKEGCKVPLVDEFVPTMYGFDGFSKNLKPYHFKKKK